MIFPTNPAELDTTLAAMKAQGRSKEEMQVVYDAYKKRSIASSQSFLGKATQEVSKAAPNVPTQEKLAGVQKQLGDQTGIAAPSVPEPVKEKNPVDWTNALVPGGVRNLTNLAKGGLEAASGAASLGEKGLQQITGIGRGGETAGEKLVDTGITEVPDDLGSKIQKGVGQYVLPTLAGGLSGASAGTALAAKLGGGKIAQGLLGFLGSSTGGTAAYSTADRGELPTGKELAVGAAIDAATLGTLKLMPKLSGGVKNVFSKMYNTYKNKGASEMTIETLEQLKKSAPEAQAIMDSLVKQEKAYLKDTISNPSTLSSVGKDIFKDFTDTVVPQKQAIGKELASQVMEADNLAQAGGGLTSRGVLDSLSQGLEDIGVKVSDAGLDFGKSKIKFSDANQKMLTRVFDDIARNVDEGSFISPSEKWTLAQALGDLSEYNSKLASQTTGAGELPITQLKNTLMNDVKSSLEQSGQAVDLFDQYKNLSDAIDALNRRFGEGGEGGFSILKALQGEQKFGEEARKALDVMKDITGVDYVQQVKLALAAADIAGNQQVRSLLSTTSGKGAIAEVIKEGFLDKELLLKQLKEEIPDLSKEALEKTASAIVKILGLELVSGE